MARIRVINEKEAEGRLQEIYQEIILKRKQVAAVHAIQSLRPESILKHQDLYMEIMYTKSLLSRAERELMAVVVSMENGCRYCQIHHGEALLHYWKDQNRLDRLYSDPNSASLSPRETALCKYAKTLTSSPASHQETNHVKALRNAGLTDEEILDATLVVSYFNFVNRMVLALGVELEEDAGKGYAY